MKKLLGLLGTLGLASTSATAVVSLVEIPKSNDSKTISKESLQTLITEVRNLATTNKDKAPDAYKTLYKAIGEAEGVLVIYQNETENYGVLDEAHKNLTNAKETFIGSSDELAKIDTLKNRITSAEKIPKGDKLESAWKTLQQQIGVAITVRDKNPKAGEQSLVNSTVLDLQTAMVAFFDATNTLADYTGLKTAIADANKALETPKAEEAMKKLRDAIKAAESFPTDLSSGAQAEVNKAVQRLRDAIEEYNKSGQPEIPETDLDLKALKALIVTAKGIASDAKNQFKPLAERNKFEEAIGHAEGIIAGKPVLGQEQKIKAEVTALQTAITNFNKVTDEKADKTMLGKNIDAARNIQTANKKPDAVTKFKQAIDAADVVWNRDLNIDKQNEYDQAAENMWQATFDFVSSANRININYEIYNGALLTVPLADSKKETIKRQLEIQFPKVKEGTDYTIGDVKKSNKVDKTSVLITGMGNYTATATVYFVLDIKSIEGELDTLVNANPAFWTTAELKAEIEKKGIDVGNGLKVTEIYVDIPFKLKRFKIKANDRYEFSAYKGEVIINQFLERERRSKTVYVDINTNIIKEPDTPAPEGTKEIIHLGWDAKTFQAHKVPSTIEKVSPYVSPKITNMSKMFNKAKVFNGNISSWDTKNVTNMSDMFWEAEKFNGDISKWNTSSVTNMNAMFQHASSFNQDLKTNGNSWNVSKVTDMGIMFEDTKAFNGDITNWTTGQVTVMNRMFQRATSFNQDLSKWNVGKVTDKTNFDTGATVWEEKFKPNLKS
ncbi:hypothetical protein ELUMI_v1c00830 [Williamsoniiplasma luminosum]|uniref:BspA family leucine-rich repeat surface protein n=1 Tax=Williamsoniiplasma luminosum TaxID=214888 RepID=A0A2K8NVN9_9MOLU|nr:BspA family leucine-rich repeat surface protein [Williamsoniiplasma luminosum]ATZ16811.1 hypothetical protein ELUMI_v1c00830 [Williamsoniiplasma luminosum]